MPSRIESKPCAKCGRPVLGRKRANRKSYHFAKHCDDCRGERGQIWYSREANPQWKGGTKLGPTGYIYVWTEKKRPDGNPVYDLEHRVVWETAYGPIPKGAHIHHKNHVRSDNRLENLELIGSTADHNRLHFSLPSGKWAREYECCIECQGTSRPHNGRGLCRACSLRAAWRKKHQMS